MTAPEPDFGTALQHQFSKRRWSQHSRTAFKVHLHLGMIKLPTFSPWPTDYNVLALMMNCYELIHGHRYYIVLTCPVM